MNNEELFVEISKLSDRIDRLEGGGDFLLLRNVDRMLANLRKLLEKIPSGPIDEGDVDNRNSVGTGSRVYWNTYPGDIYIEPALPDKDIGTIAFHFSGRERKEDYLLHGLTATNDNNHSGKVVAMYEFTRRGKVYIDQVGKRGGEGRIGDVVLRHVQSINGRMVL